MSETVIKVNNLSKKYIISHQQKERYTALRDVMARGVKNLGKKILSPFTFRHSPFNDSKENFYALKDISFEIKQGERLGIIGRNGAGKSTLLKILSRITEPTAGRIEITGRVASLLEVGTGFHPELTGRENIYLNGTILGMTREEIKRKFDEIVAFAEIEKFLDTPVKRYSSGMYVRLAFAVAAHLETNILLVDEVLAVGDAQFQKKCLGKMEEVGKDGRTVLFVSHSMESVTRLCNNGILLKEGRMCAYGDIKDIVRSYLKSDYGSMGVREWTGNKMPGNEIVRLLKIYAHDERFNSNDSFKISEKIGVTVIYEVLRNGCLLTPAFNFHNEVGVNIFDSHDTMLEWRKIQKKPGKYKSTAWIPQNIFSEGMVIIGVAVITSDPLRVHVHERDVISFNIYDTYSEISSRGDYVGVFPGMIRPLFKWDIQYLG